MGGSGRFNNWSNRGVGFVYGPKHGLSNFSSNICVEYYYNKYMITIILFTLPTDPLKIKHNLNRPI